MFEKYILEIKIIRFKIKVIKFAINIGEDEYLQSLVTSLDLDWSEIKKELNTRRWKKVLDQNLKDMYSGNCWGVPSFKITDSDGSNPFYVWGQDRMWLLKEEINKRLGK